MDRIPKSPPEIKPLPSDCVRPRWSVMIPVFNSIDFLKEAIESVLIQASSHEYMQIEVIDDASTDGDVKALVKRLGNGRINYYGQSANVGSLRNFETCINRALGYYVHILHADDKVLPGYYNSLEVLFDKFPDAGAAFCRFTHINEKGKLVYQQTPEQMSPGVLQGWIHRIADHNRIQFAAITVRRDVYETLGGYYALTYGEDWEMWVRIASRYPVVYTPEVLAEYRKHSQSITGNKIHSGEYINDLLKAMKLIQHHLPVEIRKPVLKSSRRYYAHYAMKMADTLWHMTLNRTYAANSIRKALMLHQSFGLYMKSAKLYTKMLLKKY